ncbi:LeuA family protein [Desulfopila inferna]|uniref:LeuA family protein n=1 Tax=Desulfopila inferna TaxID=468528 RepID=UPI00196264D0|nr:pyruvate carboxyltransferase [Desulfopila inferna]MBM9606658.1 pyruvate carboxyltransferase [Desulfopila inferna]
MNAIIDTTLREGEQTPGVRFSLVEKKQIIDGLVAVGIGEIEIGISSSLISCPPNLIDYCQRVHPKLICSLWCRCNKDDIRFAATIRPDILSLSIPVSDILIRDKMGKDREWIANRLTTSIDQAKRMGMPVAVGFEDATRAEKSFLLRMAALAECHGALRIRLADTIGTSTPQEIIECVSAVSVILKRCEIAIHCHNDLGMATANALSALENGATSADATILGLGERCGCTSLEELAGILKLKKNIPFNLKAIRPLSRYTAKIAGRIIPPNRPLTGEDIFTCETGLHLHGLYKNPATYEPYPPETIGATRKLVLGPKAGRRAIKAHLEAQGHRVAGVIDERKLKSIRSFLASNSLNDPA